MGGGGQEARRLHPPGIARWRGMGGQGGVRREKQLASSRKNKMKNLPGGSSPFPTWITG